MHSSISMWLHPNVVMLATRFEFDPAPGRAHPFRVTVLGRRDVCKRGAERLLAWSVASASCDNVTHRRCKTKAGGAHSPAHQKATFRPAWSLPSWKSEPTDLRRSSTALTSKNNNTYITMLRNIFTQLSLLSPSLAETLKFFSVLPGVSVPKQDTQDWTAVRISALWWVNTGAPQGCELSLVLFTLCGTESSARREPQAKEVTATTGLITNNRIYCINQKWAFWGEVRNRNKDKRLITEKKKQDISGGFPATWNHHEKDLPWSPQQRISPHPKDAGKAPTKGTDCYRATVLERIVQLVGLLYPRFIFRAPGKRTATTIYLQNARRRQ